MHKDVKEILFTEQQIVEKCKELGAAISKDYVGKPLILVGLLKGSVPFMAELAKNIEGDVTFDFMRVSSYTGVHSGTLNIKQDMEQNIEGKDVLIVEDIIDTGNTLSYVKQLFIDRKANSVKIATMLDKHECRKAEIEADYVGYVIPNAFVVGYGLDFDEKYRNLPYVGILKEEVYQ